MPPARYLLAVLRANCSDLVRSATVVLAKRCAIQHPYPQGEEANACSATAKMLAVA